MANNQFVTVKNIARQTLMRLTENLVFPNLCYKDFSETFQKQGDTIQVKKPVVLEAKEFHAGTPVTDQDIIEESVDVKLDKIATVDVAIEALEMATNVDDLNRLVIEPAAVALAQKINADGFEQYKFIGNVLGTAGTTPSALTDFSAIRKALNKAKAPLTDRVAVWNSDADAAFTQIGNLVKVNESGSPKALREGEIGKVFGLENYMSQVVPELTSALTAHTAVKLNGATTTASTTLAIDGTTLTGKLSAGDVLVIDGVAYTVKADSAAASSNAIAGIQVNEAIQAHNDNADVTVYTGGVQNLAFHKNAIAYVTRPLVAPSDKDSYTTSYNGISLRVVRGYDMSLKREKISIDVLYGYKVIYPELAIRYLG